MGCKPSSVSRGWAGWGDGMLALKRPLCYWGYCLVLFLNGFYFVFREMSFQHCIIFNSVHPGSGESSPVTILNPLTILQLMSTFSILSWNTRGLNSPTKRSLVFHFIKSYNPHICILQETHLMRGRILSLKTMGGVPLSVYTF